MGLIDDILSEVKSRNQPDLQFGTPRRIPRFLYGDLYIVTVMRGEQPIGDNYVYVNGLDGHPRVFLTMDEFALWMTSQQRNRSTPLGQLRELLEVQAISGIIALVVLGMICFVIFKGMRDPSTSEIKVPEILSAALTTILGFYFGSQVGSGTNRSKIPSGEITIAPQANDSTHATNSPKKDF